MRPRLAIVLAAAAFLALAAPAEAAKPHQRCEHQGFTVEKSAQVRVFSTDHDGDQALYACWRADGRRQRLASWFSCDCSVGDAPPPFTELHAGRYVEVSIMENCGPYPAPDCGGVSTTLRDVKTRVEVPTESDVTDVVKLGARRFAYVDGRVVVVRGTAQEVLDPGPGVEPGSLAAAGQRLYWMRGGLPFTALAG
jgi:hypothetical protein